MRRGPSSRASGESGENLAAGAAPFAFLGRPRGMSGSVPRISLSLAIISRLHWGKGFNKPIRGFAAKLHILRTRFRSVEGFGKQVRKTHDSGILEFCCPSFCLWLGGGCGVSFECCCFSLPFPRNPYNRASSIAIALLATPVFVLFPPRSPTGGVHV